MDGRLLVFLGIAIVLIITPGPDMAMVTKNALSHGRRGVVLTTLGIGTSLLLHATLAALGLAALLRTASALYTVVKLCGAAYLVYLGAHALWASRPAHTERSAVGALPEGTAPAGRTGDLAISGASVAPVPGGAPYRQGLMSALLNPKLVVFFATFLPQFVDPHAPVLPQMLLLGVIFDALGLLWLLSYGLLVTRLRAFFSAARVRRRMERLTGLVLVALAARLALEKS